MDLFTQGLTLSLTGIIITFASLGLFILIIVLLQRFFGIQAEPQTSDVRTDSASLPESMDQEMDHEVAVAIAIAINHSRSLESGSDGIGRRVTGARSRPLVERPPIASSTTAQSEMNRRNQE